MAIDEEHAKQLYRTRQLENAVDYLNKTAQSAKELSERLLKSANAMMHPASLASPDDRFVWAVNDIENFVRNINFSNAVRHSAAMKDV